jgi:hypothetical protein
LSFPPAVLPAKTLPAKILPAKTLPACPACCSAAESFLLPFSHSLNCGDVDAFFASAADDGDVLVLEGEARMGGQVGTCKTHCTALHCTAPYYMCCVVL